MLYLINLLNSWNKDKKRRNLHIKKQIINIDNNPQSGQSKSLHKKDSIELFVT